MNCHKYEFKISNESKFYIQVAIILSKLCEIMEALYADTVAGGLVFLIAITFIIFYI